MDASVDLLDSAAELGALRARIRARADLPSPAARKAIRLAAQATLAEVAHVVGVSYESIRLYEEGKRFPRDEHLARYAACLADLQRGLSYKRTDGGSKEVTSGPAA